ncbi:MAG: hypothetical protein HY661_03600 [Betaproteobacteria bacterium]|nr:hypothetical protein [Betaproteobacteria bacterium]
MNSERAASLAGIGAIAMLLAGLALPASAASVPESHGLETAAGGKRLLGQVRNLYVRLANNVLLEAARAPATMIARDAVHFVDVEFSEPLPNGTEAIRAQLVDISGVQVGDIVEIRIAHKDNPHFFPVREVTRVTELIAKNDTALARNFVRGTAPAPTGISPLQAMLRNGQDAGPVDK